MNRSIGYSPEIVLSNRCQLVCPQASPDAMPKIIDTPTFIALCPAPSFSLFSYQSLPLSFALPLLFPLIFFSLLICSSVSTVRELLLLSFLARSLHSSHIPTVSAKSVCIQNKYIALPIPRCSTINSFYFIPISDSLTAKFASNHKEQTNKLSKTLFAVCNKYYRYIPKILQICRNTYI